MASEKAKALAAKQKAELRAEKARRKNSTDPADWGRWRQFAETYKITAQYDKPLPWILLGAGLGVFAILLIVGFLLTSAAQRNESFSFVTNRLTFQLANFYFFCAGALLAGVTTVLLGSVMKIIALQSTNSIIETTGLLTSPLDFLSRIFAMTAYTLLLMLLGYTLGTLVQWSKLFIALFGVIWYAFSQNVFGVADNETNGLLYFYHGETSILLFALKMAGTIAVLFAISFFVTNRLEVRNP